MLAFFLSFHSDQVFWSRSPFLPAQFLTFDTYQKDCILELEEKRGTRPKHLIRMKRKKESQHQGYATLSLKIDYFRFLYSQDAHLRWVGVVVGVGVLVFSTILIVAVIVMVAIG